MMGDHLNRDDYRVLYNDRENGPLSDLTTGQKICMVLLVAAILATGFVEHETVSVMQAKEEKRICPRYNSAGQQLKASIVLETYVKGAPKPHECIYS